MTLAGPPVSTSAQTDRSAENHVSSGDGRRAGKPVWRQPIGDPPAPLAGTGTIGGRLRRVSDRIDPITRLSVSALLTPPARQWATSGRMSRAVMSCSRQARCESRSGNRNTGHERYPAGENVSIWRCRILSPRSPSSQASFRNLCKVPTASPPMAQRQDRRNCGRFSPALTTAATVLPILRWGRYIFRYSGPISGLLRGVDLLVSY